MQRLAKDYSTWARLILAEKQVLEKVMKINLFNESEAVRFIIREYAKANDLWPVCPDCGSDEIEILNEVNQRCEACGLHFGGERS